MKVTIKNHKDDHSLQAVTMLNNYVLACDRGLTNRGVLFTKRMIDVITFGLAKCTGTTVDLK